MPRSNASHAAAYSRVCSCRWASTKVSASVVSQKAARRRVSLNRIAQAALRGRGGCGAQQLLPRAGLVMPRCPRYGRPTIYSRRFIELPSRRILTANGAGRLVLTGDWRVRCFFRRLIRPSPRLLARATLQTSGKRRVELMKKHHPASENVSDRIVMVLF